MTLTSSSEELSYVKARTLPGMDHSLYEWSPIAKRSPITWPDSARLAFALVVNLEHYEVAPPEVAVPPPSLAGTRSPLPHPDIRNYSQRAYGPRVGLFRLMSILNRHGIKAAMAVDAASAVRYPSIVRQCASYDWSFIAHGLTFNRTITSQMSEQEEVAYINASIASVEMATGERPTGWLSPGYSESPRTLRLLAAVGIEYVCDWHNDEQPYEFSISSTSRPLIAIPISLELDDYFAMWTKPVKVTDHYRLIEETFNSLYVEGGRLFILSVRPFITGQPFTSKYLDRFLAYVTQQQGLWITTPDEIAQWFQHKERPGSGTDS